MGIKFHSQTKMARIFRRIFCPHHGPQDQTAYHGLFRRSFDFTEKLLEFLRMNFAGFEFQIIAEIFQKYCQLMNPVRIRCFMGTVEKGLILPEKILRNGFIGSQHKVFNNFCG